MFVLVEFSDRRRQTTTIEALGRYEMHVSSSSYDIHSRPWEDSQTILALSERPNAFRLV